MGSEMCIRDSFNTYSSAATFADGTTYNLAPTYKFTGGAEANITGLKVVLDTSNNNFTMSL